jgi:hypothetical protein
MIKQVFAGVVAIGSVSGVASAQSYISMSPPPAAFVPPLVVGVNPPTTTTTAASSRNSDQREVTIRSRCCGSVGHELVQSSRDTFWRH